MRYDEPNSAMAFQPLSAVKVEDDFWSPRYALWSSTTIPDVLGKLETRSHVAENLNLAANGATSGHQGNYFYDGLLYESLRGASDYLAVNPDATLEAAIDRWAAMIAAAQRPDGYINTRCQIEGDRHRWGDNGAFGMDQHEIYNAGCLIEAGVSLRRVSTITAPPARPCCWGAQSASPTSSATQWGRRQSVTSFLRTRSRRRRL